MDKHSEEDALITEYFQLSYDEWIEWAINGEEAAASNKPKKKEEKLRLRKERTKPFVQALFGGEDPTTYSRTRIITLENLLAVMRADNVPVPRLHEMSAAHKKKYRYSREKLQNALLDCWGDELDEIMKGAKVTDEGGGQKRPSEVQHSR